MSPRLCFSFISAIVTLLSVPALSANIVTYPVPDAVTDCPYNLTIDGASVPMEKVGNYLGAYYTRFELKPGSKVRAKVYVSFSVPTSMTLKPERFRTNMGGRGSVVEFDIDSPGPRVITTISGTRELWPLIILVDPYKQAASPEGKVYKITDYTSDTGVQTAGIQKALDECAANGGGTVLFPSGVFTTGSIFIHDNTTVQLSPGTLIRGSSDLKDYPVKTEPDSNAPGAGFSALINFQNCRNSKIAGPGVIDGNGLIVRNQLGKHIRNLLVLGSENITIEDVVLRNSASWTTHIFGSTNVSINHLKVLADWAIGNTDGIDPDCSQNVSINNYFAFCGDDGIAVKCTTKLRPSKNITMRNSVVMTHKSGFKLGTETLNNISDVLIEDCEAVNTGRGIGLYLLDGSTVSNITYRRVKLDIMEYPGERYGGSAFSASIGTRTGIGRMTGITFDNVTSQAPWYSDFTGQPESYISNVTFKDCKFSIIDRHLKPDKLPVFNLKYCRSFDWRDCTAEWATSLDCMWDGLLKKESSENINTSGLKELKATQK